MRENKRVQLAIACIGGIGVAAVLVALFFVSPTIVTPTIPELSPEDQRAVYVAAFEDLLAQTQSVGYDAARVQTFLFDTRVPAALQDAHLDLVVVIGGEAVSDTETLVPLLTTYAAEIGHSIE